MENTVHSFYGNKLRLRACGLLVKNEELLLVSHTGISKGKFWAPPGGGVDFGESAEECLKREFVEETGLHVDVKDFLFVCEFIQKPLHAVELFFEVSSLSDEIVTGSDPEPGGPKVIDEVRFMSWDEIAKKLPYERHGIFQHLSYPSEITTLRGYFKL
jgi:8-oxo-dGTP diphosphatase